MHIMRKRILDVIFKKNNPYSIVLRAVCDNSNGEVSLEFNPYFRSIRKHDKFKINAYKISFSDWICMKVLVKECDKYIDDECDPYVNQEDLEFHMSNLMTLDELDSLEISYCDANGMEISSTEKIYGNEYNSNTDTWGTQAGSKAVSLYFFYVEDINLYGVVESYYFDL